MKRTLLLSSAAIALTLGLTPAFAQQDRTDSKVKHERSATEQNDRDTGKKPQNTRQDAVGKDQTGAAKTTGQSDNDKAKAAETDKAKPGADSAKAPEKAAGTDKPAPQPKQAEDQSKAPANKAATDKSNTAAPAKNAEQTNAPAAQKSTQSNEPNHNAQTATPDNKAAAANNNAAPNTRISASLDPQRKTRLTTAFEKINVRPINNVNFSVSVGVAVPRTIELRPVPTTIVEIVPQYRGYEFFVVRDEVVIVEPRTHKIVDVIERGPSRARAETTTTVRRPQLSSQQREIIRKHATTRRTTTTGAATRTTTRVTVGERLPDTVEIESFPEEVYREVPSVREYRYIERGDDMYLVDPSTRTVIEEVR